MNEVFRDLRFDLIGFPKFFGLIATGDWGDFEMDAKTYELKIETLLRVTL